MFFIEFGNVHINPVHIDSIELRDNNMREWWFIVNVGKHVYMSAGFTTEYAAKLAKEQFVEKCAEALK